MKILVATAEFSPYVRSGGLGDAVAGLVGALVRAGHEVTVALPRYGSIRDIGSEFDETWWAVDGDVRVLLFDDDSFDRPGLYGDAADKPYDDNWGRFGRFARAVAELAVDFDVLHLQDAHTGGAALLSTVPTVFTAHNAAHPVLGPLREAADLLGVDSMAAVHGSALEWYGKANYLKAGFVGADQATTVSPGHAAELAVDETSFGLAGVIRSLRRPLLGIVNGIDTVSWDPTRDPALPKPFSAKDLSGRTASRAAMVKLAGIDDGFILGNVGRMARQKGFDLLDPVLDDLVDEGARFVYVGNGELDGLIDEWVDRHPSAVAHLPYSEVTARLVSAGVDAYFMPSRFEPCGLGQLYAMRYGAPPVVRLTGGLIDTVFDLDEQPLIATGFGFRALEPAEVAKTVRRAMRIHRHHPEIWSRLVSNGMTADLSWDARAKEYERLYEAL